MLEDFIKKINKVYTNKRIRIALEIICTHNTNNFKFNKPLQINKFMLLYNFYNNLKINKQVKKMLDNMHTKSKICNKEKLLNIINKYNINNYLTSICMDDKLAYNIIYKNVDGNYNDEHGWIYRPRGFINLTCRDNYKLFNLHTNPDSITNDFNNNLKLLLNYCEYVKINDNDNINIILDKFKINNQDYEILYDKFNYLENERMNYE